MRFVGMVAAIVLILAFALPAYAETQSVKISGDLTFRGIHRKDFDLDVNTVPDRENFAITTAEVQIDADLTDNVSTVIRMVHQKNWGDDARGLTYVAPNIGLGQDQLLYTGNALTDLGVDLAYVQIKELIFQPITLRIGRQDLWFGKGMVIGANQVDPGIFQSFMFADLVGANYGIGSPELTAYNSFDSVRMTIDFAQYAPFVVDLVFAKDQEGPAEAGHDVNLFGVNMGYAWDVYNAETEAYYWVLDDNSKRSPALSNVDDDQVHTLGVRGTFMPNEEWVFGGETALQFGTFIEDNNSQLEERQRRAGMANLFCEYLGWMKYMYSPKFGAEWIYTTGEDDIDKVAGTYHKWHPMFRGYYPMLIRPFQGFYYPTSRYGLDADGLGYDLGLTNQHEFILSATLEPLDDITFEGKIAKYYFDETPVSRNEQFAVDEEIGTEIDILTTYDYTEDVTFSLLNAWFIPGEAYDNPGPNNYPFNTQGNAIDVQPGIANEVIGTCKVSF